MKIKTFRAPTVNAALEQVRIALGDDAMILHSHRTRAAGLSGLLGQHWVEIAAVDDEPETAFPTAAVRVEPRGDAVGSLGDLRELRTLVGELRESVSRLQAFPQTGRRKPPTRVVAQLAQRLREQGLAPESIDHVIEALERELSPSALADAAVVKRTALALISSWIQAVPGRHCPIGGDTPPGRARVLFLVGPTGVGKTTTIAKLAALAAVGGRRQVTLATIDNYRIGAIDQLQRYAAILRLHLQAVEQPEHLAAVAASAPDLLLVDTPGCSQYDGLHVDELRGFVAAVPGSIAYLVVNASASTRALLDTAEKFAPVDGLVITKLDEAPGLGPAVDLVRVSRRPLAFVTTGPQVPDDIERASPEHLATRLVG